MLKMALKLTQMLQSFSMSTHYTDNTVFPNNAVLWRHAPLSISAPREQQVRDDDDDDDDEPAEEDAALHPNLNLPFRSDGLIKTQLTPDEWEKVTQLARWSYFRFLFVSWRRQSSAAAALADKMRDVRAQPNRGAAEITNHIVPSHPSKAHWPRQPIILWVKLQFSNTAQLTLLYTPCSTGSCVC